MDSIIGDSPGVSPTGRDASPPTGFSKDDPLGSLISGATGAATAFGSWFKATAKEKAPDLYEKGSVALSKTKVLATGALQNTVTYTKKASMAVEEFVEKKLEEHGVIPKRQGQDGPQQDPSSPPGQPVGEVPLAE